MHRPHPLLVALLALCAAPLLAGPALLACASYAPAPVIERDVEQVVHAKGELARDLCCYQPGDAEDAGLDAPADR